MKPEDLRLILAAMFLSRIDPTPMYHSGEPVTMESWMKQALEVADLLMACAKDGGAK